MISNISHKLPHTIPPEYRYPIKLLMNVRRSIAQRYQTVKHIPTVTDHEIKHLVALYQIIYALESEYRYTAVMPSLTGLPRWAEREVGVEYSFHFQAMD